MESHFSTNQLILRPPVAEKPKLPAKPAHIRPGLKPVRVSSEFLDDYFASKFSKSTLELDPGADVKLHPASRSQFTCHTKRNKQTIANASTHQHQFQSIDANASMQQLIKHSIKFLIDFLSWV